MTVPSATAVEPLRILAASAVWEGSDAYAYVKAFRRAGHSVAVFDPDQFVPSGWRRPWLRALRRMMEPALVREYNEALVAAASSLQPHVFFVFKGRYVTAATVRTLRASSATAVNVYPDVSFLVHGRYLPRALPHYDWIFQTKRFGIRDLARHLGVTTTSFFPHAYDPDVHRPVVLGEEDRTIYGCDISFVGTWSAKKADVLRAVCRAFPELQIRIWGGGWDAAPDLRRWVQGRWVRGLEFAKALVGSKINIAVLAEAWKGASEGDQITSRTFQIPATGAFMLHERTSEFLEYFDEGHECACFGSTAELVEKIRYYLPREVERLRIAACGRDRVRRSGHSVDARAAAVIEKVRDLRGARAGEAVR